MAGDEITLRINPAPEFEAAVNISTPGAAPQKLLVRYRYQQKQAALDWFRAVKGREPGTEAATLAEVIVGWSGCDVPYSLENLGLLIANYHQADTELLMGYLAGLRGARAGN